MVVSCTCYCIHMCSVHMLATIPAHVSFHMLSHTFTTHRKGWTAAKTNTGEGRTCCSRVALFGSGARHAKDGVGDGDGRVPHMSGMPTHVYIMSQYCLSAFMPHCTICIDTRLVIMVLCTSVVAITHVDQARCPIFFYTSVAKRIIKPPNTTSCNRVTRTTPLGAPMHATCAMEVVRC